MNLSRRAFLATLSALPFLSGLRPEVDITDKAEGLFTTFEGCPIPFRYCGDPYDTVLAYKQDGDESIWDAVERASATQRNH